MSVQFYPLRIQEIKKETTDCVSIAFKIPPALQETFQFTQGQYVNLRTEIDGEQVRRSYSICQAPFEGELRVAIKKTKYGIFSNYANTQLKKEM
jgi:ring-1,2-phenylacetyl-CoA epoxidase subunit PaaE